MSTDADLCSIGECTTKEDVLARYFQQLIEIQQKYAIESSDFTEMFEHEFHHERCSAATTATAAATTTPILIAHTNQNGTQPISHFATTPRHIHSDRCSKKRYNNSDSSSQLRRYARYLAWLAICLVLVNYRIELTKLFMRNIQMYIYPGMKVWRMFTLPVIQQFPQLTEFYDETCLVANPLFRVTNLDCTPCADVINVVDLSIAAATTPSHFGYLGDNNIPHIILQVR